MVFLRKQGKTPIGPSVISTKKTNTNLESHRGTVTPKEMLGFAKSQIDYNLGPNPMKTSNLVDMYCNVRLPKIFKKEKVLWDRFW